MDMQTRDDIINSLSDSLSSVVALLKTVEADEAAGKIEYVITVEGLTVTVTYTVRNGYKCVVTPVYAAHRYSDRKKAASIAGTVINGRGTHGVARKIGDCLRDARESLASMIAALQENPESRVTSDSDAQRQGE